MRYKIKQTQKIIKRAGKKSNPIPLIINFSGGKDSLLLLDLVQKITDNFICFYCISGIEFPETIESVKKTAESRELELFFSHPQDYKGDFFTRLAKFRYFPQINTTWCSRDLKWRPQKKVLSKLFDCNRFYKLNAVRRFESSRRQRIYNRNGFFKKDFDVANDIMVFPLLNWTTWERDNYLIKNSVKIETKPLYKKYRVSGCYWCPFYQLSIYRNIIIDFPDIYDKFIEWEIKLNMPSACGYKWIRDIKDELLHTKTIDKFL